MTDKPDDKRRAWSTWILGAVLALYPLSAGPAAWFVEKTDPDYYKWPSRTANVVYGPLAVLSKRIGAEKLFTGYIFLFVGPVGWVPNMD
jgi:hypothetical protein